MLFFVLGWACVVSQARAVLTEISQIQELTPEQLRTRPEVHLRGIVVYAPFGLERSFGFLAGERVIWVSARAASGFGIHTQVEGNCDSVAPGTRLEIHGVATEGMYAPIVLPDRIVCGEKGVLPEPEPLRAEEYFHANGPRYRSLEGIVQAVRREGSPKRMVLDVYTPLGFVEAKVYDGSSLLDSLPLDSRVRVRGLTSVRVDHRGAFLSLIIRLSNTSDVEVLEWGNPDPFSGNLVAIQDWGKWVVPDRAGRRQRTDGVVTHVDPDEGLVIQEGDRALRVNCRNSSDIELGDRVEVCGFAKSGSVMNAVVRKIGRADLPQPERISLERLRESLRPVITGLPNTGIEYDHLLSEAEGTVLKVSEGLDGNWECLLESEKELFRAVFTIPKDTSLRFANRRLEPGSKVRVRGIAMLSFKEGREEGNPRVVTGYMIRLRQVADLTLIQRAPFFSGQRLWIAAEVALVGALAVLLWNIMLRRRARTLASDLAQEIHRREAKDLEFHATIRERNRLAADLHDSAIQTIHGIGLQMDACGLASRRGGENLSELLSVARRMVGHAEQELRESVWALQFIPMREQTLEEAVRSMGGKMAAAQGVDLQIRIDPAVEQASEVVRSNAALIVQEAIRNALRHARAARIDVTLEAIAQAQPGIKISVVDNGIGFEQGRVEGPQTGHFGLVGMRDRAQRCGGEFRLRSIPGQGTEIVCELRG
ncbi:MAG: hypothetical protein RLZZ399_1425 [Verrucomicrobiota bacterium]|jgi:signal transduction histidine kinase